MSKINLKIFLQSILIFLAVNTPVLLISNFVFLNRAIFNLDYIFAILLAVYNVHFAIFLLIITLIVDILISGYFIFDFQNLNDLFFSLKFFTETNLFSLLNVISIFLILFFIIFFYFCFKYIDKRKINYFVLIIILLFFTDLFNSTNSLSSNSKIKLNINIAGSNFLNIGHFLVHNDYSNKEQIEEIKIIENIIDHKSELNRLEDKNEFSLILIILESFGKTDNNFVNNELKKELILDEKLFDIKISSSERFGHTMQGELQILCNLKVTNTQKLIDLDFSKYNCLPQQFKAKNIFTAAYHGFSSNFFHRNKWWSKIGFVEQNFYNDLKNLKKKCGSFLVGKCDQDMISEVFKNANVHKGFYYLLTLNTHYPYKPNIVDYDFFKKCKNEKIEDSVCYLVQIYKENLKKIIDELKNSNKKIKVIITGDHKPPFLKKEEQNYFPNNEVLDIQITKK